MNHERLDTTSVVDVQGARPFEVVTGLYIRPLIDRSYSLLCTIISLPLIISVCTDGGHLAFAFSRRCYLLAMISCSESGSQTAPLPHWCSSVSFLCCSSLPFLFLLFVCQTKKCERWRGHMACLGRRLFTGWKGWIAAGHRGPDEQDPAWRRSAGYYESLSSCIAHADCRGTRPSPGSGGYTGLYDIVFIVAL